MEFISRSSSPPEGMPSFQFCVTWANDLLPELGYLLLTMGPVTVARELLKVRTECIHSKCWEQ